MYLRYRYYKFTKLKPDIIISIHYSTLMIDDNGINSRDSKYSKWLETNLKDNVIKQFEHSEFKDVEPISRGGQGIVYCANYCGTKVVLKYVNEDIKSFVNELKQLISVKDCQNVIKVLGITIDPTAINFPYKMVLQYANGNLQKYLQDKVNDGLFTISWLELVQIARQITLGLQHLHANSIIHGDLHPNNILINNNEVLIADFGVARKTGDSLISLGSNSSFKGTEAYFEPQCFIVLDKVVKIDEKSDIYSLGVLLWELTSGHPPFSSFRNKAPISYYVSLGHREKPVPSTPSDYVKLYKKCWDTEPECRPTINEILCRLDELSKNAKVKVIKNRISN
ncbi:kinase-like domain-containing protein [Gigaspora rosea]|uniref:Kinase-like domain-containing protein n=1 Tax=Gigaspora rosea TaxID=44941 RepID=A0A397UDJ7_9GLOM|nr:kinase-like domain-containing protein [Gigaspora rosea]